MLAKYQLSGRLEIVVFAILANRDRADVHPADDGGVQLASLDERRRAQPTQRARAALNQKHRLAPVLPIRRIHHFQLAPIPFAALALGYHLKPLSIRHRLKKHLDALAIPALESRKASLPSFKLRRLPSFKLRRLTRGSLFTSLLEPSHAHSLGGDA